MKYTLLIATLNVIILSLRADEIVNNRSINKLNRKAILNTNTVISNNPNTNRSRGEGLVTSEFVSSKVKVALSCEPEETIINLNFTEPFRGVILAGDTQSRCRIRGDGQLSYVLRVPHNSCDTRHVISKGSFVNTLFIRFHPSLEMGGDHSKTIVCKFGTGSFNVS